MPAKSQCHKHDLCKIVHYGTLAPIVRATTLARLDCSDGAGDRKFFSGGAVEWTSLVHPSPQRPAGSVRLRFAALICDVLNAAQLVGVDL
jgi:hypothetical protein